MCTLILGRDVVAPGTVLLGANRDEDPGRPSDPPGRLRDAPLLAGGRDRVAGGTWLALRENRAVIAILNRHDDGPAATAAERRSRGLLALEVAAADGDPLHGAALVQAYAAVRAARYAPFSLVFASAAASWLLTLDGAGPRHVEITPGWHVLTHRELDDPDEPRAAHLLASLAGWQPLSRESAAAGIVECLRRHGMEGAPAVCLHEGRMVTVSSTLVWLDERGALYSHAEGRPCEHAFEDHSALTVAGQRR